MLNSRTWLVTTVLYAADKEFGLHSRKFHLTVLLQRSCQGTQTSSLPIPRQSRGLSADRACIPGSSSPSGLRFSAASSVLSWSEASSPSWTGEGLWSFSSSSREGQEHCLHQLLSTCPYLKRYTRLTHSPGGWRARMPRVSRSYPKCCFPLGWPSCPLCEPSKNLHKNGDVGPPHLHYTLHPVPATGQPQP